MYRPEPSQQTVPGGASLDAGRTRHSEGLRTRDSEPSRIRGADCWLLVAGALRSVALLAVGWGWVRVRVRVTPRSEGARV